ncbi:Bax inhibitor 1 AltName: Full=BH3 domain-containing protein bxi1 [Serendipita indica DSM 11827]|uniref:Related to C-term. of A.nidulans regulatory protein (QutR) n=1 Tax=Serendipita indica (strain DSM 11827) TaxID=1109443 RepID=G4TL27_SERID|nr:Bax inhibitor 1 AltName: Full=BH3 domain-containing protein bxi1 [Serendipita indica DSM 11827]CCA72013.1 related to C-term. of A.nidulans regulatory protein (qutR) [Serendipita indica DSM 11827]
MSSAYPANNPPSYGTVPGKPYRDEEAEQHEPLLFHDQGAGPSNANAIYNQAEDLPDDFKYGVNVASSAIEVRQAFVRKVYSILFAQIVATTIVGGALSQSVSAISWIQNHVWAFYIPLFGSLIFLGLLYWKRHSSPMNFVLLGVFTLMEAVTLGVAVAFYDNIIVMQALLITVGVFLGLTLFTFQSKYDFSGMAPFLFGGLMALVATGLVGIFIPFSRTVDLVYAAGGCVIFSGYIVYDTYVINKKLSPDEYIMGAISLYLDFINLFLSILRVLNNVSER